MIPFIWRSGTHTTNLDDRNQTSVCMEEERPTTKGQGGAFWSNGNVWYFDWNSGYMRVHICQNSSMYFTICKCTLDLLKTKQNINQITSVPSFKPSMASQILLE